MTTATSHCSRLRARAMDSSTRPIVVGARSATSFAKLDPRVQIRNPVMFVVYVGSIFTT